MAKSMQLMKVLIPYVGTYVVTYHEDRKVNPFVITLRSGNHTNKAEAYANYGSCWEYLRQIMLETDNYDREDMKERCRLRLPESL